MLLGDGFPSDKLSLADVWTFQITFLDRHDFEVSRLSRRFLSLGIGGDCQCEQDSNGILLHSAFSLYTFV